MKKRILSIVLTTSILSTIILGCGNREIDEPTTIAETVVEETVIEPEIVIEETVEEIEDDVELITVADIKKKYGVEDTVEIRPFYNVGQKTEFTFPFNSKVEPCLAVTVHTDPKCLDNSSVYQINDAYDNGNGYDIVVKPGKPVLNTSDRESGQLDNYNWGYAPIYYLCIRYDMYASTPTKLEEPIVVPFTIKSDVSTPNLTCDITTDGQFKLTWKPVDGAVAYNIYEAFEVRSESSASGMTRAECGYVGDHLIKLITVDADITEFLDFKCDGSNNTLVDTNGYIYNQNFYDLGSYYITAIDANGNESQFSMAVEGWKYKSQLPETFDKYEIFNRDSLGHITYLPDVVPVRMIDNSVASMPINYEKIGETLDGAVYKYNIIGTKLQGEITYYNNREVYEDKIESKANVPYNIYEVKNNINIIPDNTVNMLPDSQYIDFEQTVIRDNSKKVVYGQDVLLARADLESARIIQDGVFPEGKGPSSMLEYGEAVEYIDLTPDETEIDNTPNADNTTSNATEGIKDKESDAESESNTELTAENFVEKQIEDTVKQKEEATNSNVANTDYMVFAESAEEEYLALALIDCQESVDLTAFPELLNAEYLLDVLYKVIYQNPYIFGVNGFSAYGNAEEAYLTVEYDLDANTIKEQQKEVYNESINIIENIITDGMSDEAKIMAIWTYLEENTKYDYEALEAAEKTNFQEVIGHEDAFSSYGIMCRKVGVCQSYSHCFNILCNLADVESVALVGFLNKTLPHAWNAVNLNGTWYWMDVTNNKYTANVPYSVYQTSSEFATMVDYVLDDRFDLNNDLTYVLSNDNTKDWYTQTNLFASTSDDLVQMVANYYKSSDEWIFIKCKEKITFNDTFIANLVNELVTLGADPDIIMNSKVHYVSGVFAFQKGNVN